MASSTSRIASALALSFISLTISVLAADSGPQFDNSRSDNVAVYWGQHTLSLSELCQDDTVNAIPIAFLTSGNGTGGLPTIDLSGNCNGAPFEGTGLLDCSALEPDIQACQQKGKILTLSIGGANAGVSFTSDAQAESFAELMYNTFLGGNSSTRPFGNAALDGYDLDIEGGGTKFFSSFVKHTLEYAKQQNDDKKYYITGAPQCPFMDENMKEVLADAPFDALYVQFYNNPPCELKADGTATNFDQWDNWAQTASVNKDVKIYIGAPADPAAANNGYVEIDAMAKYVQDAQAQFPSFGGVMLWDAYFSKQNSDYAKAVKSALAQNGTGSGPSSNTTTGSAEPTHTTGAASTGAAGEPETVTVTVTVTGTTKARWTTIRVSGTRTETITSGSPTGTGLGDPEDSDGATRTGLSDRMPTTTGTDTAPAQQSGATTGAPAQATFPPTDDDDVDDDDCEDGE